MKFWHNLKGRWFGMFPYVASFGRHHKWGLSYKRLQFRVSRDMTTPYILLHIGPYEFFIRPRSTAIDWF